MGALHRELLTIEENGRKLRFWEIVLSKILETVFLYVLGTINSLLLSGYAPEAVTIANIANQIFNLCVILPNMAVTGMAIHMNIALGQRDTKGVAELGGTATVVATAVAVLIGGGIILLAEDIIPLMNVEPFMVESAVGYLRLYLGFLPVVALMNVFNNLLICNGYASRTFLVGILYNLLNAGLCYLVLYTGILPDAAKLNGVAWMSGAARVGGTLAAMGFFWAKRCSYRLGCKVSRVKQILRVGIPGGMNGFSYHLSLTVTTAFVALLGISVFNTKVYISNIIAFSSVISLAIAQAGAIFSGRYRGKGQFESIEKIHRQNLVLAIAANLLIAVLLYLFHVPLIGMFTQEPAAIQLAGRIMLIDIGVEIFRAINQVSDQSLNANGDVMTTLLVSALSCWGFSVLFSYLLGIRWNLGLSGVWIAFLMEECFKTVVYTIRWRSGKWKSIRI